MRNNGPAIHFVYALLTESGLCRYIGQTIDLDQRRRNHSRRFPDCELFVVSAFAHQWITDEVERRTILVMWQLGEAQANAETSVPVSHRTKFAA